MPKFLASYLLSTCVVSCALETGDPIHGVNGLEQAATSNIDHLTSTPRPGTSVADIWLSTGCVWSRRSDSTSWRQHECSSTPLEGLAAVSLPGTGRRCYSRLERNQSGKGVVRMRCEANAFSGDFGPATTFSTTLKVGSEVVSVKRLTAVSALRPGATHVPGFLGITDTSNRIVARWFVNGAWSSTWCDLGVIPGLNPGSLRDISVSAMNLAGTLAIGVAANNGIYRRLLTEGVCSQITSQIQRFANIVDRVALYPNGDVTNAIPNVAILTNGRIVNLGPIPHPPIAPELFRSLHVRGTCTGTAACSGGEMYASTPAGAIYWRRWQLSFPPGNTDWQPLPN